MYFLLGLEKKEKDEQRCHKVEPGSWLFLKFKSLVNFKVLPLIGLY